VALEAQDTAMPASGAPLSRPRERPSEAIRNEAAANSNVAQRNVARGVPTRR